MRFVASKRNKMGTTGGAGIVFPKIIGLRVFQDT